ncbi:MAG: hypothetical protein INQ03_20835 [Candidatus Heimdallarchaeota archaeon]|nr:hypothetical protein [Candidatus Heimdallarchaeota archaeon]
MSSSLILKLSLVGISGINIAEYPPSDREDEQVLAAGLLTALMAFSREVHKRDLQSISYHDRRVSFIPIRQSYIIVAELASSAKEAVANRVLDQIRFYAESQIPRDMDSVPYELAFKVLGEMMTKDWLTETLDSFGLGKPFASADIHYFKLLKEGDDFDLDPSAQALPCFDSIKGFIIRGEKEFKTKVLKAFIPISQPELQTHYLISRYHPDHIEVGLLHVKIEQASTLFKLTPIIDQEVEHQIKQDKDITITRLLEIVKETHDIVEEDLANTENISFKFLENSVKKKLDSILYSVVTGERVIISGDRPSVRIMTSTLNLFAQHRSAEVIEWLEDDVIGPDITGVSADSIPRLDKDILENSIWIDLDKRKVNGPTKSNKYMKSLFSNLKKMSISEGNEYIKQEIKPLITQALDIIYLVMLKDDDAVNELDKIKKEVADNDKLDIILHIASRRNPWIEPLLQELSSRLLGAEDYFSQF